MAEAVVIAEPPIWRLFPDRVFTFCLVELQKLRDRKLKGQLWRFLRLMGKPEAAPS